MTEKSPSEIEHLEKQLCEIEKRLSSHMEKADVAHARSLAILREKACNLATLFSLTRESIKTIKKMYRDNKLPDEAFDEKLLSMKKLSQDIKALSGELEIEYKSYICSMPKYWTEMALLFRLSSAIIESEQKD